LPGQQQSLAEPERYQLAGAYLKRGGNIAVTLVLLADDKENLEMMAEVRAFGIAVGGGRSAPSNTSRALGNNLMSASYLATCIARRASWHCRKDTESSLSPESVSDAASIT